MQRLTSALSFLGREALGIVLPSWCVACRRELPWEERTASCCASCWRGLPRIEGAKCDSCALPLPGCPVSRLPGDGVLPGNRETGQPGNLCIGCLADPLPLDWCEAWGEYRGSLERVLHALKFERHDFLDDALATLLEETLRDHAFDAVAAVPMQRAKERRRGYNQAELLARALARRTNIACDMRLLTRRRAGATQSSLPKRDRAENVRGAFAASPNAKDLSILLVDDISTTGETLRACATALRAAGASRVCAVAVAKAI